MANDITKSGNGTALANPSQNPFTDYGNATTLTGIVGKLLKFSKGDYTFGQDNEELPEGTRFVANMDELLTGWIRWEDNRPTDHVMGKVSESFQIPRRNTLGDNDPSAWEIDQNGKARDPWQLSNYLLLKSQGMDDAEGDDLYTFTTSSKGGLNAIGLLCKKYGAVCRQKPNEYPIIEIGVGSYKHPNPEFGRIKFPTFEIVGWAPKAAFAGEVAVLPETLPAEEAAAEARPKPIKATPTKAGGVKQPARF